MTKQHVSDSRHRHCSAAQCVRRELASTYLCGELIQPCCRGPRRHVGAGLRASTALAREELHAACVRSRTQSRATYSYRHRAAELSMVG
jgi:hypothetical protein